MRVRFLRALLEDQRAEEKRKKDDADEIAAAERRKKQDEELAAKKAAAAKSAPKTDDKDAKAEAKSDDAVDHETPNLPKGEGGGKKKPKK